jgi:UDP-N-acetylglucosamine--N-acetylmuramyl-(pentapeptide) pyrophosphoryl-undecaprenol N-acetylglucosamine transferase
VTKQSGSVLLAAGGTGGHLFPAQALAEELARRGIAVDLATDMRGDRYGTGFPARTIHRLPSATLGSKSPVALARTALLLSRGLIASFKLLGQIKPKVVVGFGGYPTFPPLKAASLRGIPTLLHEQNAVLGRANKMLAKGVTAIATSFATTKYLAPTKRVLPATRCAPSSSRRPSKRSRRRCPTAGCRCWCSAAARVRATSPR